MTTTAHDTKTVNGLAAMFYARAVEQGRALEVPAVRGKAVQFTLTAKQFAWLRDVARREDGFVPPSRTGRASVQGEITGVGGFEANEQKYGSALVKVRMF